MKPILLLELTRDMVTPERSREVSHILGRYAGPVPVLIAVMDTKRAFFAPVAEKMSVDISRGGRNGVLVELREALGDSAVHVVGDLIALSDDERARKRNDA